MTGHVIFKLRYNQIYQLKTTYYIDDFLTTFISLVYRSGYISSRSERSDYERDYRDTPPRVGGNPGGVSSSSRRRNSRDVDYGGQDYDYQRRDKRSDRLKESRHGKFLFPFFFHE